MIWKSYIFLTLINIFFLLAIRKTQVLKVMWFVQNYSEHQSIINIFASNTLIHAVRKHVFCECVMTDTTPEAGNPKMNRRTLLPSSGWQYTVGISCIDTLQCDKHCVREQLQVLWEGRRRHKLPRWAAYGVCCLPNSFTCITSWLSLPSHEVENRFCLFLLLNQETEHEKLSNFLKAMWLVRNRSKECKGALWMSGVMVSLFHWIVASFWSVALTLRQVVTQQKFI